MVGFFEKNEHQLIFYTRSSNCIMPYPKSVLLHNKLVINLLKDSECGIDENIDLLTVLLVERFQPKRSKEVSTCC
jgi:hypothetical protein